MNTITVIPQHPWTPFLQGPLPRLADYMQRPTPREQWTPDDYLLQAHATVLVHQDYGMAARMLNHALRRYPGLDSAQRDLGSMKAQMDQYQSARWYLTKYLVRVPYDALAYRMRGSVHGALGMHAGAARDFDHALILAPEDWLSYHYRANANQACGRSLEARMDMLRANECNVHNASPPKNPWAISALYFAE